MNFLFVFLCISKVGTRKLKFVFASTASASSPAKSLLHWNFITWNISGATSFLVALTSYNVGSVHKKTEQPMSDRQCTALRWSSEGNSVLHDMQSNIRRRKPDSAARGRRAHPVHLYPQQAFLDLLFGRANIPVMSQSHSIPFDNRLPPPDQQLRHKNWGGGQILSLDIFKKAVGEWPMYAVAVAVAPPNL